jgi:hypothetical protein
MTTSARKGCCTNAGGYWEAGATGNAEKCKYRDAAGNVQNVTNYWNAATKTCQDT